MGVIGRKARVRPRIYEVTELTQDRPSPAIQDYLKAIYRVVEDTGYESVATSQVAESLGVTPPSVSAMLKRLVELGYVVPAKRRGSVELSPTGRIAALEVIRHHRLLETYLVTRLGVPWEEVHREAEILEHHISEELEARIAEELGHPERDPHGAPIPTIDGEVGVDDTTTLADVPAGATVIVRRVSSRSPELLRFLADHHLVPDARLHVVESDPLRVQLGTVTCNVPPDAAHAVRVHEVTGER